MFLYLSLPYLSQTRPYPLTADRRSCQHALKTQAKPRQVFNSVQFRHLSSRHTFYAARFYPVRQIKTFPPPAHMSMSCLLFLTVYLYCTFFLCFIQYITKPYRFHQFPNNSTAFYFMIRVSNQPTYFLKFSACSMTFSNTSSSHSGG